MAGRDLVSAAHFSSRAEVELLLLAARLELSRSQCERVEQLLASQLDWGYLLDLAEAHGLRPLLFRHLNAIAPATVPKHVLAELWARQEVLSRRNQVMADELKAILRLFDENGIRSVPYKGPVLAVTVYGDIALREFGDLDILLSSADVLEARKLLEAWDYHSRYSLQPSDEAAFLRAKRQYDFELVNTAKQILVELHWRTDSEFRVESTDDPAWWARLGTCRLGDAVIRDLEPQELLLVLCLHGIKHHWSRLGWLVDVSELIRQNPRLNWDWVLAAAKAMACEKRLAVGLHMAQALLNTPLPDEVGSTLLRRPGVGNLSMQLQQSLFDPSQVERTELQALRLDLRLYDHARQKIRRCTTLMFEPNMADWADGDRLGAFRFLYPAVRWCRLIRKHAFRPIGRG